MHRTIVPAILLSTTLLSASILLQPSVLAADDNSVITTTTINVPEACTMNGTVNTAHSATLIGGTYSGTDYANGIGQTTLKVFCNDSAGFAIYAIGYTNDEYGNNKLHWSGASSASDDTNAINTGIYTSGFTTTSTWSMKLAAVSGTYAATIDDGVAAHNDSTENFTTWHTVPTEYKRVAYRLSGTDAEQSGAGTGSSITTTYDAYVSNIQPAGSYNGQVKYTLVHPSTESAPATPLNSSDCPAYSVCYAPNATDIIGSMSILGSISSSPMAGKQTQTLVNGNTYGAINESTSMVTLIAPNFTRPGFGFAGWSPDFTINNSSVIYGPNADIVTDAANGGVDLSDRGLILYPVWIAADGIMQDWDGCSSLDPAEYDSTDGVVSATLDSLTALTDSRDGNVYTVARLADGLCWMVDNLRINNEHTTSAEDIAKAQGYNTGPDYGDFIGLADSERSNFGTQSPTVVNSLYSSNGSSGTINIGTSNAHFRIPRYNKDNTDINNNELSTSYNHSNTNFARWFGYGNSYNWPAAAATTGFSSVNASICPKGWKLPKGGYSTGVLIDGVSDANNIVGGYSYLDRVMGGTGQNQTNTAGENQSRKWRSFPNNFVFAGRINGNRYYNRGNNGHYWSDKNNDRYSDRSYELEFMLTRVYPNDAGSNNKYEGHSVRCVLE